MSTPITTVAALAFITLFMIVSLFTVGQSMDSDSGQIAAAVSTQANG